MHMSFKSPWCYFNIKYSFHFVKSPDVFLSVIFLFIFIFSFMVFKFWIITMIIQYRFWAKVLSSGSVTALRCTLPAPVRLPRVGTGVGTNATMHGVGLLPMNWLISPWKVFLIMCFIFPFNTQMNGSLQERRNSSVLAMELHLSCTNPSR